MFKEAREKARELRSQGLSLNQIVKEIPHSKSTISLWVRDISISDEQRKIWLTKAQQTNKIRKETYLQSIGYKEQKTKIDQNYNPKEIGEISVAQILAHLVSAGKTVLTPFGDNKRYDLVVEEDGKFYRIQCKTARFKGDHIIFRTKSNNWNSGKNKNYLGQIDLFAVYFREQNQVYLLDVNDCPTSVCLLRLVAPFGKCNNPSKMAEGYKFIHGKSIKDYLVN